MRLAVVAAGFTPGEADQLRRAMGAWPNRGDSGISSTAGRWNGITRAFTDFCRASLSAVERLW